MFSRTSIIGSLLLFLTACGSSSTATNESTLEACQDKQDNDGDGLVDCDDDECQIYVACLGGEDASGNADVIILPEAVGETASRVDSASDTATGDNSVAESTPPEDVAPGKCCYGSIKGIVCAPNQQVFVSLAIVSIDTEDCQGQPVHLQTISQVDGTYYFENVPCGMQPVHIEKGNFNHDFEVIIKENQLTDISGADMKMCFAAGGASIGIFWGQWDQMNEIVDRLGFYYDWFYYEDELYSENPDWEEVQGVQILRDLDALLEYNIVILNCGSAYKKWLKEFPEIVDNLHQWVLLGGSLYMSDLAWVVGEKAFPDAIDFWGEDDLEDAQVIEPHSTFDAALIDAKLAEYVGAMNVKVYYDSGPLISVSAAGVGTTVHAIGHIKQCTSFLDSCITDVKIDEDQPVLLSYEPGPGAGRVVYSGFHVEEQESQELYDKVLYYVLFLL